MDTLSSPPPHSIFFIGRVGEGDTTLAPTGPDVRDYCIRFGGWAPICAWESTLVLMTSHRCVMAAEPVLSLADSRCPRPGGPLTGGSGAMMRSLRSPPCHATAVRRLSSRPPPFAPGRFQEVSANAQTRPAQPDRPWQVRLVNQSSPTDEADLLYGGGHVRTLPPLQEARKLG
jgi:hypothetical protein